MKKIIIQPSGKSIDCPDGESVLSVLEKQGYALPNNCRAGACGECKIKVLSGTFDQGFVMDMALSQADRAAGYGLMCMAKPTSDVLEIEFGTQDAQPKLFPPVENSWHIITDKIQRTDKIMELKLLPLGKAIKFWPGQYAMIGEGTDEHPLRPYSIANAPKQNGELSFFITKEAEGKTSPWIHHDTNIGDNIKVNAPYGTFLGDPSVDTPILCLASGSGLAPILSLLNAYLSRGHKNPVTLLFSAKTKKDLLHFGEMKYLESKYVNFKYKYTLTQESNKDGGLEGRIDAILPDLLPNLANYSIYIAGSVPFVESCKKTVEALGAEEDLIHMEEYFAQQVG
ncbi:2Fe-2S iron-sulfur cluster-binding protein [Sulfurospirillum sp. 1612]|uniref:2Fe-2S iron-sulfur cluster-binding protein n=1 Tax=Sulfurospirillum sp. 1612 TaxID=3094835 RepID=UPI002F91DA75